MMRHWGLDFIRCVECKHYPLQFIVLEQEEQDVDTTGLEFPVCKNYCAFLGKPIIKGEKYPCEKCLRIGIKTGVLYCPNCGRWYPIKNGIVYLLPDKRRKPESDIRFLEAYKDRLPEKIVYEGKPFSLSKR
ncbi:Trm112 family protein [Thermogladius sp. 4427co]|uniref:Trm112 family protein n=1 Tax=Thermogladius sp. 4427co TaxID=3450718 RepID=UPI003F78D470